LKTFIEKKHSSDEAWYAGFANPVFLLNYRNDTEY
jgi:hypothetical protein